MILIIAKKHLVKNLDVEIQKNIFEISWYFLWKPIYD